MWGGIESSRKILFAINIFNIAQGIILIGVGAHCNGSSELGAIPNVGGIIACGLFLLLASILGCFVTYKQHQSLLFYYMLTIGFIFIIQFSVSMACLAVRDTDIDKMVHKHWEKFDKGKHQHKIRHAEEVFGCCGLNASDKRFTSNDSYWEKELEFCYSSVQGCSNSTTSSVKPATTTAAISTTVPITKITTSTAETTTIVTSTTVGPTTKIPITTVGPTTKITTTTVKTTTKISNTTTNATTSTAPPTTTTAIPSSTTTSDQTSTTNDTTSSERTSDAPTTSNPAVARIYPLRSTTEAPYNAGCPTCYNKIYNKMYHAFNACGGLGLFFSVFELLTIFFTYRFRTEINSLGF